MYYLIFGIPASGFFIYQIFYWLKNGQWISLPIWKVFGSNSVYKGTDYEGWNQVIGFLLNTNISLAIILIGIFIYNIDKGNQ
jgi:hypothetical protein